MADGHQEFYSSLSIMSHTEIGYDLILDTNY
jgi:hypothetical protein